MVLSSWHFDTALVYTNLDEIPLESVDLLWLLFDFEKKVMHVMNYLHGQMKFWNIQFLIFVFSLLGEH